MSASERRQRTVVVALRLLPEEHDKLQSAAQRYGCSVSELLRRPFWELLEFGGYK